MNIEEIDLRTPLQKQRDERNLQIMNDYELMLESLPKETSKFSIWRVLGEKYNLKPQGIRRIVTPKDTKNGTDKH